MIEGHREGQSPPNETTTDSGYLDFMVMQFIDYLESEDTELSHKFQDFFAEELFCSWRGGLGI